MYASVPILSLASLNLASLNNIDFFHFILAGIIGLVVVSVYGVCCSIYNEIKFKKALPQRVVELQTAVSELKAVNDMRFPLNKE